MAEKKAKAVVKAAEVQTEKAAAEKKAPAKKPTARKPVAKAEAKPAVKAEEKAAVKAEVKPAAKTVKKAAPKAAKKAAVAENVRIQFADKDYAPADLLQSARDVWQYDLGRDVKDITSIDLYVKPEESRAYYVINGDVTGGFAI